MYLKELLYIKAIAEEGSISRAAERLFMAQSSLSEFLTQYEAELGARLFVRSSTGVRPTDAGRVFLETAGPMLLEYKRMQQQISDIQQLQAGTVELGASTFRGTYLLPPVLHVFSRRYPGVTVNIHEANSMALEQMLQAGEVDIGLIALPLTRLSSQPELLMRDEICIIAAPDHPVLSKARIEKGRSYVDPRDLGEFEFILSDRDTILGHRGRDIIQKAGISPTVHNDNITAPFAAAMACQGLGLAFTYRSCRAGNPHALYLSIGPEGEFLELALMYADGFRSRATRALREVFFEVLGGQGEMEG